MSIKSAQFKKPLRTILLAVGFATVALGLIVWGGPASENTNQLGPTTPGADREVNIEVLNATTFAPAEHATAIIDGYQVILKVDPGSFSKMRISTDVTFADAVWVDAANTYELASNHSGYQQIFAEFGNSDTPLKLAQTAAIIKPQSADSGIVSVQPLNTETIVVRIRNGSMTWSDGDSLIEGLEEVADPALLRWTIDDEQAEVIGIRSFGHRTGVSGDESVTLASYDFVLGLPKSLEDDAVVTVETETFGTAEFSFDPTKSTSPLVQVSQAGWSTRDSKVAYVGGWPGKYDPLEDVNPIELTVFNVDSGKAVLKVEPDTSQSDQAMVRNSVYSFDISDVNIPGTYRACALSIGCSLDFRVNNGVWLDVTGRIARSAYHQRSGTPLGLPYSTIERPRPRHPDDGTTVLQSELSLLEAETTYVGEVFEELENQATTEEVSEFAWGGHHDAGDWDRRIQHVRYARFAADLVREHPGTYARLNLRIPESDNDVPDLLDEGLWTLDVFKRMQTPDGGIRGGIEATDHPHQGAKSWTSDLQLYAFAPDPWASFAYAAVAAEYAHLLKAYNKDLADTYTESALAAANWALDQPAPETERQQEKVEAQKLVAAAALLELTRDESWHDLLSEAEFFTKPVQELNCQSLDLCDAAWIYLRIDSDLIQEQVRTNILESFTNTANSILEFGEATPYGWTKENPDIPNIWGLGAGGAPKAVGLIRAYKATQEQRYLDAAVDAASFSVGANPLNTSYITGVGKNSPRSPLIVDSVNGGLPIWPGTPLYGNHAVRDSESWLFQFRLSPAGVSDDPTQAPYLYQWQDMHFPQWTEFTMHQSHAVALYVFGSIAATSSDAS